MKAGNVVVTGTFRRVSIMCLSTSDEDQSYLEAVGLSPSGLSPLDIERWLELSPERQREMLGGADPEPVTAKAVARRDTQECRRGAEAWERFQASLARMRAS